MPNEARRVKRFMQKGPAAGISILTNILFRIKNIIRPGLRFTFLIDRSNETGNTRQER
jgi:hypothetical protein